MAGRRSYLAKRATSATSSPLTYWSGFQKAHAGGLWTPDNPDGYICMAVAENRLSTDLVEAGLKQHALDWPGSMLFYQDARGIQELRASLARMAQRTFMQGVDVDPDHLTVLTGCGSIIDLLLHCVAERGDVVLIPAPYYPAFDNDLKVRDQVEPLPVHLDMSQQDLQAGLEAAAAAVRQQGKRVAAVLFVHPTNPQGLLFSRQQLRSIVSWCLKSQVHCIADEVYALSVYEPAAQFTSTAQVLTQDRQLLDSHHLANDLVHLIFGASKDFCASGLRVGVLYSKSADVNAVMGNLGYFASIPAPLQYSLSKLFADDTWMDGFLAANKQRLWATYQALTGALDAAGIPYTPAPAGLFLWLDLRAAFGPCSTAAGGSGGGSGSTASNGNSGHSGSSSNGSNGNMCNGNMNNGNMSNGNSSKAAATFADEAELWEYLVDVQKLVLTPGAACHAAEPGFFRMCWAWHPDSIPTAVQRLAAAVQQYSVYRRDVQHQHLVLDQEKPQKVLEAEAEQDGVKQTVNGSNTLVPAMRHLAV